VLAFEQRAVARAAGGQNGNADRDAASSECACWVNHFPNIAKDDGKLAPPRQFKTHRLMSFSSGNVTKCLDLRIQTQKATSSAWLRLRIPIP
jgi:hypothetical protein